MFYPCQINIKVTRKSRLEDCVYLNITAKSASKKCSQAESKHGSPSPVPSLWGLQDNAQNIQPRRPSILLEFFNVLWMPIILSGPGKGLWSPASTGSCSVITAQVLDCFVKNIWFPFHLVLVYICPIIHRSQDKGRLPANSYTILIVPNFPQRHPVSFWWTNPTWWVWFSKRFVYVNVYDCSKCPWLEAHGREALPPCSLGDISICAGLGAQLSAETDT